MTIIQKEERVGKVKKAKMKEFLQNSKGCAILQEKRRRGSSGGASLSVFLFYKAWGPAMTSFSRGQS